MKVGIIGCGFIGEKRAKTLASGQLRACCDLDIKRAEQLAAVYPGAKSYGDWQDLVNDPAINVVIISVSHHLLAEIGLAALQSGKHILIEKPGARFAHELTPLLQVATTKKLCARVGFNHRYHRSLQKAKQLIEAGELGELMFLRGRYGHGGRLGYDREWRADPVLSGGGELIDQGVHLIDLARWFFGEFEQIEGFAHTYYWDMPVDDNAFLLLRTSTQQAAHIHVSCTEWKNTFSLEIYGKKGKIELSGLGGSYGVEKIIFYKMLPEMGPPETYAWEYPMADHSWQQEWDRFMLDIQEHRVPDAGLHDAQQALKIVEKIYRSSGYDHYA